MNKRIVKFGVVMGALVAVAGSQQAQAADTVVNMQVQDYATVAATASITVVPTLADIVADTVTVAGDPITLTVDSTNGSEITFSGGAGTLADADLQLSSDAGATWVSADNIGATPFYKSTVTQSAASVPVKVKINNLSGYEVGNYANTVTFTIVAAE